MCGIAGKYLLKTNADNTAAAVADEQVFLALNKRGPDSSGFYTNEFLQLYHCRLSILDTSSKGAQPMHDASERYILALNGEIFNFKELKAELLNAVQLQSGTDTEVLLHLLINNGIDKTLPLLNGFFAFAFYDKLENKLILARDRYGVKPLMYAVQENALVFASELKALFPFNPLKEIDENILHAYFQLNYIPDPHSIFKSVKKLGAGTYLSIAQNQMQEKIWYQLPVAIQKNTGNAVKQFVELLDNAVQKRLIADVPLGAFLSGGLDSSAIVALASRHQKNLKTFSIGFSDEPYYDETSYAEIVAKHFNTQHQSFRLSTKDLLSHLFDALDYFDEPFADSSALAVYILSKKVREHVTVALSGDGADELLAGYNKHRAEYQAQHLKLISPLAKPLAKLIDYLPQGRGSYINNLFRKANRFAGVAAMPQARRYWEWCAISNQSYTSNLLKAAANLPKLSEIKKHYTAGINESNFNSILAADFNLVLAGDMLVKVDRMSMANSLEIRNPFLDFNLVDFCFQLDPGFKINAKQGKLILRQAMQHTLPSVLLNRPKKGFEIPLLKWFKNELSDYLFNDILAEQFIKEQNIFQFSEIERLRKKLYSNNPGDTPQQIWALLVFQYWWKKYVLNA